MMKAEGNSFKPPFPIDDIDETEILRKETYGGHVDDSLNVRNSAGEINGDTFQYSPSQFCPSSTGEAPMKQRSMSHSDSCCINMWGRHLRVLQAISIVFMMFLGFLYWSDDMQSSWKSAKFNLKIVGHAFRAHWTKPESFGLRPNADKETIQYLETGPRLSAINVNNTFPVPLSDAPNVFLRYIEWHAKQMNCLRNKTCYEQRKSHVKVLLWQCAANKPTRCSGSGDRLRGIISSFALAMLTKRVFLMNWPDNPYPFLHAVSPAAIDWRLPVHMINDTAKWGLAGVSRSMHRWNRCPISYTCYDQNANVSQTGVKSPTSGRRLPLLFSFLHRDTYKNFDRIGNIIINTYSRSAYGLFRRPEWKRRFPDPKFHSPPTDGHYLQRYLMRALLRPSPVVSKLLHKFIPEQAFKDGYVAVHARTGHDVRELHWYRFKWVNRASHETIARNLIQCAKGLGVRDHHYIFLASDSMVLKSTFAQQAKNERINLMFSRIPAMHVGHKVGEGIHNEELIKSSVLVTEPNWLAFLNVFVEFFAIANGKAVISNRSEFSRLAHVLSNAERLKVINASAESVSCL